MFEDLRDQGEETPLDHIPELILEAEIWFYKCYQNLKSLSGFEYHLTITDFKHYFDIYPIPFTKTTVISIIKKIDKKVAKYHKDIEESKKEVKINTEIKTR